jgi:endonuclease YncB( thermonuclease family)
MKAPTARRSALALALCALGAASAYGGDAASAADLQAAREFSAATLAKIVPGVTTAVEVQGLLGKPARQLVFGSGVPCPPKPSDPSQAAQSKAPNADQAKGFNPYEKGVAVSAWDYHAKDSTGDYLLRVEFDARYVTYLVAKIPRAGTGIARVPAASAESAKPATPQ